MRSSGAVTIKSVPWFQASACSRVQLQVGLATCGPRLAAFKARAAPKRNESSPIAVNHTAPQPGDLGTAGFHGSSFGGGAFAKWSQRIPCPDASAARDGGMTPTATAVQGRVRWGALGYRISRESPEEEAETREETGAVGVKEEQRDVLIAHIHIYETTARLLVPYQAITDMKGLIL